MTEENTTPAEPETPDTPAEPEPEPTPAEADATADTEGMGEPGSEAANG